MISVFTPLSQAGNAYIEAVFETLLAQTHEDWEWVVLENHGGRLPETIARHPRVRVFKHDELEGLGQLKRASCAAAAGDIFFELDHDDLLHPDALAKTFAALQNADVAYSDFAEFRDGDWTPDGYRADYGWHHYQVNFQGHELIAMRAPPITAQNMRRVDYCPHHLKAWRRDAYFKVGGYDAGLYYGEDQDLLKRFFLHGLRFEHLAECLYFYRIYPKQTAARHGASVDERNWEVYEKYITALGVKFADTAGLAKLELCQHGASDGTGRSFGKSAGIDLEQPWPLADDSVGLILAEDVLQQLRDPVHVMNEAYRVLAPGGFLLIRVPSTDGRGAFQDPRSKSFWNEHSFWYYTQAQFACEIPEFKGRFQVARLRTFSPDLPNSEHVAIPYVEAHLFALKPGYEPMGAVLI
ncbi:MAG TPA: glycosyltransferase [Polyangiaceae bacterium]|nr:glycosyltransferase [Polyangiaceae bacterium]